MSYVVCGLIQVFYLNPLVAPYGGDIVHSACNLQTVLEKLPVIKDLS